MSDDTISRQAAIDALERIFNQCEEIEAHFPDGDPDKTGYKMFPDYMTVWKYLHQLPSAERRGRWINGNEGIWNAVILPKCSICGETFYEMNVNINGEYPYNYCPNCGARMEAE